MEDLLRDYGESRTPYHCKFNERTSLICLDENPSNPALLIDSVSTQKYTFYQNLMMNNNHQHTYSTISSPKGWFRVWKNDNRHLKLISNITGLQYQDDEADYQSTGKIVFQLDRSKLLVPSNSEILLLNAQLKIQEQLGLDDLPLLTRADNHILSPNLETLLFLWQAHELSLSESESRLSEMKLPSYSSLMIKYFGNQLVDLFYRLWNGVEKSSGKAEASYTEEFSFEEDMPATSFLLMSEEKSSQNQPKQPNSSRDHTGNVWERMRHEEEFLRLREIANNP